MKIAVFWKKYNGSHHREIRRIFSFIFHGLSELGYDFDIFEQNYYQNKKIVKRASRKKFLQPNSWTFNQKPCFFKKGLPNMPFEGYHFKKGYDKSIMFHTIGNCPDTAHVKPGYFPGSFYFDYCGYSGWSEYSTPDTVEDVSCLKHDEEFLQDLVSRTKYSQPEQSDIPTTKPFLFVPLQVASDSVSNLCDYSMNNFIEKISMLSDHLNYDIIFKRHPKCTDGDVKHQLMRVARKPNIHVCNGSVIELTKRSEGVLVANSGVGIEALLKGKPVVSFGDSDYAWLTYRFSHEMGPKDINDYIDSFDEKSQKTQIAHSCHFISHNFIRIGDLEGLKKACELKLGAP